jgi:hypothetical protein
MRFSKWSLVAIFALAPMFAFVPTASAHGRHQGKTHVAGTKKHPGHKHHGHHHHHKHKKSS